MAKGKVTTRMVLLILLATTIPAIIWALIMFYAGKACGLPYHAKFSPEEGAVILFQDLDDEQRGKTRIPGIILGCLLALQIVVTIVLYLKILFRTYMATIRVALRKTGIGDGSLDTTDTTDNEDVRKADKIKTERRNMFSLPHREDYEDRPPRTGTYMVNVPMTKVVICVSKQDIVCTASLSSQVASLIVTFILTIVGFSISGKIVTIDRFFTSYYCTEVALIMSSIVDPLTCVLFSRNFRKATISTLKQIMNTHKSSVKNEPIVRYVRSQRRYSKRNVNGFRPGQKPTVYTPHI